MDICRDHSDDQREGLHGICVYSDLSFGVLEPEILLLDCFYGRLQSSAHAWLLCSRQIQLGLPNLISRPVSGDHGGLSIKVK